LHWASRRGHTRLVKGLLEAGADANARNLLGSTPLMLACVWGHEGVLECLIEHDGALTLGTLKHTALTSAAYFNNPNILDILLRRGATFGRREWWTILDAAAKGNLDVARILLENGVDPNFKLTQLDDVPLTGLEYRYGGTALHLAVAHKHTDMVALLLKHGANYETVLEDLSKRRRHISTSDEKCLYELCGRNWWQKMWWKLRH
jgi:ankyrin repeat protein